MDVISIHPSVCESLWKTALGALEPPVFPCFPKGDAQHATASHGIQILLKPPQRLHHYRLPGNLTGVLPPPDTQTPEMFLFEARKPEGSKGGQKWSALPPLNCFFSIWKPDNWREPLLETLTPKRMVTGSISSQRHLGSFFWQIRSTLNQVFPTGYWPKHLITWIK